MNKKEIKQLIQDGIEEMRGERENALSALHRSEGAMHFGKVLLQLMEQKNVGQEEAPEVPEEG